MTKTEWLIAGGLAAAGVLYYLSTLCKNDWFADPDIIREGNTFTSSGGLGHRIWIPNKLSGEGNIYDGKTAKDSCDISNRTIKIDIENLSDTVNVGVEMNGSYGFSKSVLPHERVQLVSTPTGLRVPPLRTLTQSEQPSQPFARCDILSLNVWFHTGKVKIHSVEIS